MLKLGSKAPSFRLPSSDGGVASLAELLGKVVVIYFYPRDNTPGCTIEAQDFRDHHAALRAAGAAVLGVSRDSIASHCKFRDKYNLTFPLLSDPSGEMMTAYGAWGEKVMYGKKVTGVIRSTVIVDSNGKVARHWPKVNVKGHAAAVLEAVRELGASTVEIEPAAAKPSAKKAPAKKTKAPAKKIPAKKAPAPAKKIPAKKAPAPAKKAPAPAKKIPAKKAQAQKAVKKPSKR